MTGDQVELRAAEDSDPAELSAYEELLDDAPREDYVEQAWRIVQPVLDNLTPVHADEPGSWGPAEAEKLTAAVGGWRNPE